MALVDSLLSAIVRADGEALVMHVGERPYVVVGSQTIHISAHDLNIEAMTGMLTELLPQDAHAQLEEFGAVEHKMPAVNSDRFNVVAARGGDDIWIEIRRRRSQPDAAVADAPPAADTPLAAVVQAEPVITIESLSSSLESIAEPAAETAQREREERERLEQERLEQQRLEEARQEQARLERERLEHEQRERERLEADRLEHERQEQARLEHEQLERERIEQERLEHERLEQQRVEEARQEQERLERERLEHEQRERERLEAERLDHERQEQARLEQERLEQERLEQERVEEARLEQERLERERLEHEQRERERLEAERLDHERQEQARLEHERLEQERLEQERLEQERVEEARQEQERLERERREHEQREHERLEAERREAERLEYERAERERLEHEELERQQAEHDRQRDQGHEDQVIAARVDVPAAEVAAFAAASDAAGVGPLTRTVRIEVPPRGAATTSVSTDIERLLQAAAARGAAALFVSPGSRPFVRIDGDVRTLESEGMLSRPDVERIIVQLAPDDAAADLLAKGEPVEWTADVNDVGRVHCTTFIDHRGPGVLLRLPATRPATADQLGLSRDLQMLATEPEGLVLIAGPRGGGKSTLLSALVDVVNRQRAEYVISLERQLRVVHDHRAALISQREVRGGAEDAVNAVRNALRESPDVLVVDELVAPGTVPLLLNAASEGLLVLASLPAASASDAVQSLVDMTPPETRKGTQSALAESFRGAVAQVLLKKASGGRIAGREVLLASAHATRLIADGQLADLAQAIEQGRQYGMASFTDVLTELVRSGTVDVREAFRKTPDRQQLLASLKQAGVDTALVDRLM